MRELHNVQFVEDGGHIVLVSDELTVTLETGAYEVERTVNSLTVVTPPDKVGYVAGEMFDATGIEVIATMSDGSTDLVDVSECTVGPCRPLAVGDTSVIISYKQADTTVSINVMEVEDDEQEG